MSDVIANSVPRAPASWRISQTGAEGRVQMQDACDRWRPEMVMGTLGKEVGESYLLDWAKSVSRGGGIPGLQQLCLKSLPPPELSAGTIGTLKA